MGGPQMDHQMDPFWESPKGSQKGSKRGQKGPFGVPKGSKRGSQGVQKGCQGVPYLAYPHGPPLKGHWGHMGPKRGLHMDP